MIGYFMPASFPVPQNPVNPGMGSFVPAAFPVPQNPIYGQIPRGLDCGCGCGGSGGCGEGMGNLDLTSAMNSVTTWVQGTTYDIPNLYIAGAGALLLVGLISFGGRGSSYRSEVAKLREKYPTAGRRIRRSVAAAQAAF